MNVKKALKEKNRLVKGFSCSSFNIRLIKPFILEISLFKV